mgnify:CR=1 FL=1
MSFFFVFLFCLSFFSWEKNGKKKMGKNGESGGLPLFETYGKKKNKKESAFLYTFVSPAAFSTHRTHLWKIIRVDIKKEEEKRTGNERRKPT